MKYIGMFVLRWSIFTSAHPKERTLLPLSRVRRVSVYSRFFQTSGQLVRVAAMASWYLSMGVRMPRLSALGVPRGAQAVPSSAA